MNSSSGLFITVNDRPLNPMHITYYYVRDEKKQDGTISYNIYYRMLEGRVITEEFTSDSDRNAKLSDLASTEIKPKIIDDLTSTDANAALSANQGRVLKELCDAIPKFKIQVVDQLPTEDISVSTIYLVRNKDDQGDLYQEYIYVDGKWELLGIQRNFLDDYYTKDETNSHFLNKTNTTAYTPTADYHPATKKYVDDKFWEGRSDAWDEKTQAQKEAIYVAVVEGYTELSINDNYSLNAITGTEEEVISDMYEEDAIDATNEIIEGGTE